MRRFEGSKPEEVWKSTKLNSGYSSPLYHQGRVYALTGSFVTCVDALNGEELWKQRVDGKYSATPVLADGKLYVANDKGTTTVIEVGDKPKVLATNALDDTLQATPAIAGKAIFLRSDGFLYCVGSKEK